eukprot:371142_1
MAEEAIVLGVRGSSYVQNKWKQAQSPPASPKKEKKNVWVKTPPAPQGAQEQPVSEEEEEERDSFGNKIVKGAKSVAEEALVLGVRGYSYIDNEWQTRSNNASEDEAAPLNPE